ncbi:YkgJ family cysteine cluster protein [Natronoflexus pectinivorans]|uniref:Fe-S-cluster containining protein n=1 Tax=Natronoflexus pectinivorans TaxID=682526 RepID=A0A4R2GNY9_9BACT|nr:YkgJ family cysteine cluster protein [Natronoflexus pectinivorans]TCO11023.1 Fe-S-cluster containining protein [Natronoflexus pectinivorans]
MILKESIKKKYLELRQELDEEIAGLEKLHQNHMLCKKGCSLCCLSFKVLPIEFEVIRSEIERLKSVKVIDKADESDDVCPLLIDNSCTIYPFRPFICRTHGLPLLYMNDEEWVLSHCELNFTNVDEDYFSETRFHEQDRWNSRLYMLNQEFLKTQEEDALPENELIPLAELLK